MESKFALNSMFGIWAMGEQFTYQLNTATDPDDVMVFRESVTPSPESEMIGDHYVFHDYITKTKMLSCFLSHRCGPSTGSA